MLDADNLPLIDPTRLLEHSSLALHGNLFWPDLFQREGLGIVSPEAYSLFQLSPPWTTDPDFHHTESGQFVIDRSVKYASVHHVLQEPVAICWTPWQYSAILQVRQTHRDEIVSNGAGYSTRMFLSGCFSCKLNLMQYSTDTCMETKTCIVWPLR